MLPNGKLRNWSGSIGAAFLVCGCSVTRTTDTGADWDGTVTGPAYLGFHVAFSPMATDAFAVSTGETAETVADRHDARCSGRGFEPYCDPREVDQVWYNDEDGEMSVTEWFAGREYKHTLRLGRRVSLECGLGVTMIERDDE